MSKERLQSHAEARVWKVLRTLRESGVHIRRQHPIGRYKVDFAVARERLAIEIDGGVHELPGRAERDAERQTYIENMGWRVLRFTDREPPEHILDAVRASISPSPRGEGAGGGVNPNASESDNPIPTHLRRRTRANRILPSRQRDNPSTDDTSPHPLPPPLPGRGLREKLIRQIEHTGPLTVAQFMAAALYDPEHGYYVNEPNIGEAGDFITAPEVSQMFGELIGLWRAHEWETIGKPDPIQLIELGPGRGTLAADARRAARIAPDFNAAARYAFIESNAAFQKMQRDAMAPDGVWHVALNEIPEGPSLIVANEFFDCLPIRQFIRKGGAWRERLIGAGESGLAFGLAREAVALASLPRDVEEGAIYELAPALQTWVEQIAARITQHKGRALIIDYAGDGWGDTLQSMRAHKRISPLEAPGESDLTAHVDFAAMARLAEAAGLAVHGPVAQGAWLKALGVEARAARLVRDNPDQAENIARDLHRLTDEAEMGVLFQVLCLSHPALPAPAGF